jgi:hypothetical protein
MQEDYPEGDSSENSQCADVSQAFNPELSVRLFRKRASQPKVTLAFSSRPVSEHLRANPPAISERVGPVGLGFLARRCAA